MPQTESSQEQGAESRRGSLAILPKCSTARSEMDFSQKGESHGEGRKETGRKGIAFLCSPVWLPEMGMRRGGGTPSAPGLCSARVLTGWQGQVKDRLRAKREKAGEVTKAPTELKQAICLWLGWANARIHELHSSVLRSRSVSPAAASRNLQAGGSAEGGGKAPLNRLHH